MIGRSGVSYRDKVLSDLQATYASSSWRTARVVQCPDLKVLKSRYERDISRVQEKPIHRDQAPH